MRERVLREREPALRARDAVARGFAAVERLAVERLAVERLAVERFAAGLLREADAPADLARVVFRAVDVERLAVERLAVERFAVEGDALDLARELVLRLAVERRAVPRAGAAPETRVSTSAVNLPDMTRCAASATASAMSEPNLVALDTMLLAACEAVSAASRPASRIFFRTAGLALIAAAAAASPAASISLLIAALASLSTVLFLDLEVEPEDDREEVLLADLAIALSPSSKRHFKAATSSRLGHERG